ncbi:hypothetical protein [Salmonella phage SD-15_S21]|nr:hypothetical protein [Salmonella phage SD-15_S21]
MLHQIPLQLMVLVLLQLILILMEQLINLKI